MTFVWVLLFGGLFAMLGAAVEGDEGFIVGAAFGLLTGLYTGLRVATTRLERRLETAQRILERLVDERSGPASQISPEPAVAEPPAAAPPVGTGAAPVDSAANVAPLPAAASDVPEINSAEPVARQAPGVEFTNRLFDIAKGFFTTGNVVVKVGIVVLFFGVSFLIKYAHERALLPIEVRLSAVAAFGIALLVVGWKLRERNRAYAMTMQGGAVGILYLTVFGAARLYDVLPLGLAFGVMLGLVMLSAALAVLQNAPALAAFGSAGGFLAPVLTSTGQGSHVALFSYYAVLNFGIFGIAWFKAWRVLNWLGFVFTFIIATLWGSRYYTSAHFASTEPFLIVFVLFYVAITVLFATRQPPRLRGFVDASLVFGVPTVGFALQSRLMRDIEFGLAYSALALGVFYIGLAYAIWIRHRVELRLLAEAFLALGVVFSSLALPLALDGHWTAAAWSLEAAGILWIGLRQERALARAFALLLQLGAACLFVLRADAQTTAPAVLNSAFIGAFMIAGAGVLSAYLFARYRAHLRPYEMRFEPVMLVWGLWWWAGAMHHEITLHAKHADELAWFIIAAAASALLLASTARRLDWRLAAQPPLLLLPFLGLAALGDFALHEHRSPVAGWYGLAWATALPVNFVLLRRYALTWSGAWQRNWHAGSCWLGLFLLTRILVYAVEQVDALSETWVLATAGAAPAVAIIMLRRMGSLLHWPVAEFETSYCGAGLLPVVALLLLWLLVTSADAAHPAPLAYLPLLNPLEAGGALVLTVAGLWYLHLPKNGLRGAIPAHVAAGLLATLAFIWFNSIIFRTVHHVSTVAYDFEALWRSPLLQSSLSIAWTVLGSIVMAAAALKLRARGLWIVGAALLGLVVLKLFTVDLADIGTIARIVSFLGVGAVLLVIGYFAPLPPTKEHAA